MVATPWGDSASLRERRLRPGGGRSRQEVARSQRARIFGAIVANTGTKGYERTRLEDIEELSGVSARSFYELFPDKEAAFVEALGRLLEAVVDEVSPVPDDEVWTVSMVERLRVLGKVVEHQVPAARMCLIEAYVAGTASTELVESATRRGEGLLAERLAESPERAEMPAEMAVATVGAVLEILRGWLVRGTGEIEEVMGPLRSLLFSFRAPTAPLRSAARPPEIRPEAAEASDHAERALRAFEALLPEQRLAQVTMEQVAERARMSRRTLYANFPDRPGLLAAAIDTACAQVAAVTLPAYRRHEVAVEGLRAALGALLALLSSRPNLAHLLLVATHEGGRTALERRAQGLRPVRSLLRQVPATPPGSPLGGVVLEATFGGILWMMRRRLLDSGAPGLVSLGPICTYISLAPLIGAERATIAAEGRAYRRSGPELLGLAGAAQVGLTSRHIPIDFALGQERGAAEIAAEMGIALDEAEERIASLVEVGLLEATDEEAPREERVYRATYPVVTTEDWGSIEKGRRESMSAEVGRMMEIEVAEAVESGSFDARPERHLIRIPAALDDQGWREMSEELDLTIERCLEIERRSRERLAAAGTAPRPSARVYLVSFEAAPSPRHFEAPRRRRFA